VQPRTAVTSMRKGGNRHARLELVLERSYAPLRSETPACCFAEGAGSRRPFSVFGGLGKGSSVWINQTFVYRRGKRVDNRPFGLCDPPRSCRCSFGG